MTWKPASPTKTRPDLKGTFGMAASTHWLATATAQSVLERGGNAFDAAVAGAFVLHIVEPHLNGPGGDLVGLILPAGQSTPQVLMGQGPAPAHATIEHYRAEGLDRVPGSGALAAAVPGAVDAWLLLLRDHGTWEARDVLQYAVDYAADGHPLLERTAKTIATMAEFFEEHWPTSAARWLVDGRPPVEGDLVRNPAWSETLRRLVVAGDERAGAEGSRTDRIEGIRTEWREGFVAREIAAFVAGTPHRHSTGADHRGVLDLDDLATFQATYDEPVSIDFRGSTVFKAGAWTQGPILLQTLALLAGFSADDLDLATEAGIHRAAEALKLALADRESYYGDDLDADDLETLIGSAYADTRRPLIGDDASLEVRPGGLRPDPYLPKLVEVGGVVTKGPSAGEPTVDRSGQTRGDTCHIDVVDRWGNILSVTPSGGWLQSSPDIPALGFCLGTRLQMTWLDERSPSALRPGKRPRTTLSPTMVRDASGSVSALGTPGGDQQDQWQLLYLLRTIVGGQTAQQAIDAPAFHSTSFAESFWPRTWTPGGLVVEERVGADVVAALEARGHRVSVAPGWSLGRLSSVTRDAGTGVLSAAANPRGAQGYAAGR